MNKSKIIFLLVAFFSTSALHAAETTSPSPTPPPKKENPVFDYFKDREIDFFPVPVFESRPDEGETYGLMPVVLMSDQDQEIKAIFAAIGQYNSVTKFGGGALAYFFPEADQEIKFYGEMAQRYYREFTVRFFDPHFFEKFHIELDGGHIKTPFGRFFGLGAQTSDDDESNFTARNFFFELAGGYYFLEHLRGEIVEKFHTTDLLDRALDDVPNTLTRYGGLPNVVDSTNLIHEFAVVFDNRPHIQYSKSGSLARLAYFFSNEALGSDKNFQGWNLEAIHLFPLIKDRMTTALRFYFQEVFGKETPFYELSSLGGAYEFRAFVPGRFIDQGKIIFQIEERIKLFGWSLLGIPFEINADPFFEVGRVFSSISDIGFNYWQPIGGLGFRLFVPPNVVGRLDMAVGSDGFEIYTELGYPF